MRVILTDTERGALETWNREGVYACPHTHHCPTPDVCAEKYGLFAEVESIVSVRVAGALRGAADENDARRVEIGRPKPSWESAMLRALADEYEETA